MLKSKKSTSESIREQQNEQLLPQVEVKIPLWINPNPGLDKSMFLFNAVVGEGGFGCVYSALLLSSERYPPSFSLMLMN
jgi:hypothetical protein